MRIPTTVIGDGALLSSRVVKASPAKLYSLLGYNSGAAQHIQIHETTSLPANGVVPKLSFPVGGGLYYSIDFGIVGADLSAITVCNSTTAATKTLGAADCSFVAVLRS